MKKLTLAMCLFAASVVAGVVADNKFWKIPELAEQDVDVEPTTNYIHIRKYTNAAWTVWSGGNITNDPIRSVRCPADWDKPIFIGTNEFKVVRTTNIVITLERVNQ